ncbi:hypothetical protein BJX76DRAFT_91545 [Aspergillus varians]
MSSKNNPFGSSGDQSKQATSKEQMGASSSMSQNPKKDPTAGWSVEEMLETGMDKDGNIISDPYSYIDGARLSKGEHGSQEADEVSASLDDFD